MKEFCKKGLASLCCLLSMQMLVCAQAKPGNNAKTGATRSETEAAFQKRVFEGDYTHPPLNVIISEVCYWPKPGESEWVELANVAAEAVDIKGWRFMDGQAVDFTIADQALLMPPGGFLVVLLDGTGQPPTSFDAQKKAMAHSPKGVTNNVLGDKGGQLALYSPGPDRGYPPVIRSYVAWGWSPGRIIADATRAGKWLAPGNVPDAIVPGTNVSVIVMGAFHKEIQQGGSIGWIQPPDHWGYANEIWGVFAPSEVNPGRLSTRRGITLGPPFDGSKTGDNGIDTLSAVRMEDGIKYEFQVCADKTCQRIFIDATVDEPNYILEKPIPRNTTYYWRARLIYVDGTRSDWSEARSLTNGYPK